MKKFLSLPFSSSFSINLPRPVGRNDNWLFLMCVVIRAGLKYFGMPCKAFCGFKERQFQRENIHLIVIILLEVDEGAPSSFPLPQPEYCGAFKPAMMVNCLSKHVNYSFSLSKDSSNTTISQQVFFACLLILNVSQP